MKKYFDNLTEALQNFLIEVGELFTLEGVFSKNLETALRIQRTLAYSVFILVIVPLLLVSVTGFIIGLVFTLQSRPTLQEFGAVSDGVYGECFYYS